MGLHGSPTAVMEYDRAHRLAGGRAAWRHGGDVHDDEQRPPRRRRAGHRRGRGRAPARAGLRRASGCRAVAARGRDRHHRRPRRRAADADDDEGRDACRARHRARLRAWRSTWPRPRARTTGRRAPRSSRPSPRPGAPRRGSRSPTSAMQVHGGMGFIEETGAAQFLRDVRVTAIYEGTNGIQAMDLVGRKLADGGEAANWLLDGCESTAEPRRGRRCPSWPARLGGGGAAARDDRLAGRSARPTSATRAPCPTCAPSRGCWARSPTCARPWPRAAAARAPTSPRSTCGACCPSMPPAAPMCARGRTDLDRLSPEDLAA